VNRFIIPFVLSYKRNIDLLDNESIYLSREQIAEILNCIGKLNNKLEGIKKNFTNYKKV